MDKVVVITGANSGIGYAAAKIYESKGYFVVLGCRNQEKGIATEKEIGKNSKFIKLDMTDYESIDNFYNNLINYLAAAFLKLYSYKLVLIIYQQEIKNIINKTHS